MTYADMFSKVKGMMMEADVSTVNEHLAYQFNVTGEAEGIFYAEVKESCMWNHTSIMTEMRFLLVRQRHYLRSMRESWIRFWQ